MVPVGSGLWGETVAVKVNAPPWSTAAAERLRAVVLTVWVAPVTVTVVAAEVDGE